MEYKVPKFKVLKDFTYFHHGYERVDYEAGDVIDTDDEEMIEVAIAQQWAEIECDQQEPAKRGSAKK